MHTIAPPAHKNSRRVPRAKKMPETNHHFWAFLEILREPPPTVLVGFFPIYRRLSLCGGILPGRADRSRHLVIVRFYIVRFYGFWLRFCGQVQGFWAFLRIFRGTRLFASRFSGWRKEASPSSRAQVRCKACAKKVGLSG